MLPSKMVMASQDHGLQAVDIEQARKPHYWEKEKEEGGKTLPVAVPPPLWFRQLPNTVHVGEEDAVTF